MWSTLSLPLLPGPLCVVVPVRVPSMDQIKLFIILETIWLCTNNKKQFLKPLNYVQTIHYLSKAMNPFLLPWSIDKIIGQTELFRLGLEGELWIQTSCTLLKNWPCIIFCLWQRGWVNTYYHHHHVALSTWISLTLSHLHRFRYVFKATSCMSTELLYIGSYWSSCLCSPLWRGLQEYVMHEFIPTSPAVSRMSGSSNFDSFRDGW